MAGTVYGGQVTSRRTSVLENSTSGASGLSGGLPHYYNNERIKLKLKGLSPVEYRLRNTA